MTTTLPSSSDALQDQLELEPHATELHNFEALSGHPNSQPEELPPPVSQPDAEISPGPTPGASRQVSAAGEAFPSTEPSMSTTTTSTSELTQALRRDTGLLDGLPRGHLADDKDYIPVEQQKITYDDLYAFLSSRTEGNVQKRAVKYRKKSWSRQRDRLRQS